MIGRDRGTLGRDGPVRAVGVFRIDKKMVDAELRLLRDDVYAEERVHVLDFVTRLQAARTAQDYFDLHIKLLGRMRARQQVLGEVRDEMTKVNGRIRELAKDRAANRDALRREQEMLDRLRHAAEVQSALRFALLNVGDGLAWRALDYDRAGITVLGDGKRVAWLADKDGFDAEVVAIDQYWQQGIFAFHNDLTTCIRHGDITAITPRERFVAEVKRGRTGRSAQMERLERATTILNTGRYVDEQRGITTVVDVPVPYRTFLANLRDLIGKARRTDGYAAGRIGQIQFAAAIDHRVLRGGPETEDFHPRALEKLGWFDGQTRAFTFTSAERRMRDRRYSFAPVAPFSIFPLPPEDVTDLILGYLDFYAALNVDLLERSLRSRGVHVQIAATGDPDVGERFLTAVRRLPGREVKTMVNPQTREQILMEFMTPASLAASINAVLDAAQIRSEAGMIGRIPRFQERRVWLPAARSLR